MDNMEVEAALVQLLEGVVGSAVERVVGLPQGLAVACNNEAPANQNPDRPPKQAKNPNL